MRHTWWRCARGLLTATGLRGTVPIRRETLMTGRFLGSVLAGLIVSSATPAGAASWFELNFGLFGPRHDALVPLCDDRGVLIQIHSKFSHKETEFWASNLEILGIDRIREVSFRPWQGAPQAIPRRFCN